MACGPGQPHGSWYDATTEEMPWLRAALEVEHEMCVQRYGLIPAELAWLQSGVKQPPPASRSQAQHRPRLRNRRRERLPGKKGHAIELRGGTQFALGDKLAKVSSASGAYQRRSGTVRWHKKAARAQMQRYRSYEAAQPKREHCLRAPRSEASPVLTQPEAVSLDMRIERRFLRRHAKKIAPRESACPRRRKCNDRPSLVWNSKQGRGCAFGPPKGGSFNA